MNRILRVVLLCVCLAVFLVSGFLAISTWNGYREGRETYQQMADDFAVPAGEKSEQKPEQAPVSTDTAAAEAAVLNTDQPSAGPVLPVPPITVDFAELQTVNPDVVGWIYSEGTVINYPVVQGTDNSYYLKHLIDGTYNSDGSIFVDCENRPDFSDGNTVVYGHNMKDGMMFAELLNYTDQSYYEAHPVIWLLTPQQNYQVVLYAGYTTDGTSDTYTIFESPGAAMWSYTEQMLQRSDFVSESLPNPEDRQVVLSTCAYSRENARYVVHGVLRPCG